MTDQQDLPKTKGLGRKVNVATVRAVGRLCCNNSAKSYATEMPAERPPVELVSTNQPSITGETSGSGRAKRIAHPSAL